jgi:hypothetical protein
MGTILIRHWPSPARRPILQASAGPTGPAREIPVMPASPRSASNLLQDALVAAGALAYFGGFLLAIERALERLAY